VHVHGEAPPDVTVLSWATHQSHQKPDTCSENESMAVWWRFDTPDNQYFAPNAAYLTIDLLSRFESSWWVVK
jgi:hypothetical protein